MNSDGGLRLANVSKQFGPVAALTDVSIDFAPGEIHAVLGENGAGKSTLLGILSGFVRPDGGALSFGGTPLPVGRAFACRRMGIEMVHQHFTLVANFTVAENLALARLPRLLAMADVRDRARPALEAAQRLGWDVDPDAPVRTLAVGARQRIEILKALGGDGRVLILDEPTAVLSAAETEDLFRVLRRLRDEGRIVILIAHKLSEVLAVADRITVLRRGRLVATVPRANADALRLAEWMVGELPQPKARPSPAERPAGEVGFGVEDLVVAGDRGEEAVRGVSFELNPGEIVGFGGVDGNGQVELAEALAGIRPVRTGGRRGLGGRSVGYIPQDRQLDGLALRMSVQDNLLVGAVRRSSLRRGPFLRRQAIREWARSVVRRFDIRVASPRDPVGRLSGGNQQKIVVGRTLDGAPSLLVAVNPTRGLDIRATEFVHEAIRSARDDGAAVALFTTDADELFDLSDRRYFMSRGRLAGGDGASTYIGEPGPSPGPG